MSEPATPVPVFNTPLVVRILIGVVISVFLLDQVTDRTFSSQLYLYGALVPARFDTVLFPVYPGGWVGDIWVFFTYTFLHSGWTHLILNMVWLLAFGSPVARRLGARAFLFFYFTCGVAGGLTHVLLYPGDPGLVVGASAAVSGLVGGAVRFVFLAGGALGLMTSQETGLPGAPRATASIWQALGDRRALTFVLVWLGLNVLFGLGGFTPSGDTVSVAWEAHMGGFLAGLFLFGLFDPVKRSPSGGPGNVGYGDWRR